MNGTKGPTNGASSAASGIELTGSHLKRVAAARERFAAGADSVRGIRPEILMSWYRCREEYDVDPGLDRAPAAAEVSAHSIEHDVVFAELGGEAASAGGEVEGLDSLVTVADPEGGSWPSGAAGGSSTWPHRATWPPGPPGPSGPAGRTGWAPRWRATARSWSADRSTGARASTRGPALVSPSATWSPTSRWRC